METEKILALHSLPTGHAAEIDGLSFTVVYHDSYLDESITVLDNFSGLGKLAVAKNDNVRIYTKCCESTPPRRQCPLTVDEITDSGRDKLAELAGAPDFYKISGMLPPYDDDAYIAIGHPASERSATVDRMGRIFCQRTSYKKLRQLTEEIPVYEPEKLYGDLGRKKPRQYFLDGKYPLLFNVHESESSVLESLYIQETGTYRSGGAVYVRNVVTDKTSGKVVKTEFRIVGTDCPSDSDADDIGMSEAIFYDCFLNILEYFEEFEKVNSKVVLPVKELERSYIGTMFTLECLFSAERMRYGHRIYGTAYHDFFPPSFIVALIAYSVNGQTLKAGRLAQYVLANAVDSRGRILYRQGDGQNYGFSASELGQFLWVLSRYEKIFEPAGCLRPYHRKILAMGNYLMSKACRADEIPDVSVIRTCAEADTNERVHDYLENTLWGIRGLDAICKLSDVLNVDTSVYGELADKLRSDIDVVCRLCETDSPYGKLIPFRLGYAALPLTLSKCRDTAYPVSEEEYGSYIKNTYVRSDSGIGNALELIENCYANYRYYPEMLSSALLDREYESSIIRMREELGGEILGMTRWMKGADDWPAYNLAIHYMERGEREKFIRLLFSHAAHHGLTDFHIYYEQIEIGNERIRVKADSCVPSIMLNNLMINMMFCYERVDSSEIELMKGIPSEWLGKEELYIDNVYTSRGRLSLLAEGNILRISFDADFGEVRLWLNGFDTERLDAVACLNDNVRRDGDSLIVSDAVGEKFILLS